MLKPRRSILAVTGTTLLLSILFAGTAFGANITFQVTVPPETPPGDFVYIAGDFQGWNPGDPVYRLTEVGPLLHEITLTFTVGTTIQFKFTRGDWARVEKGPNGEEIPNRTLFIAGDATEPMTVVRWADIPIGSTIVGDVTLMTVPGFLSGRRVWVYLPPNYNDDPSRRFPVLYMLDGQNVFDTATSFAGEWEVDETCEALIPAGEIRPLIVVAVANGETARIDEYTPWFDPQWGAGGGGETHLQAFRSVLMPYIDASYRTLTGPRNTGFAGSSLGGLMAMYAAYAHADVFGLIGSVSPSIHWDSHHLIAWADSMPKPDSYVYMDMGTRESGVLVDQDGNGIDDHIDDLRALRDVALGQGFVLDQDLKVVEDEGAQHSETYWAARFPDALRFLFPPGLTSVEPMAETRVSSALRVYPNPFRAATTLDYTLSAAGRTDLRIYDVAGRLITILVSANRGAGPHAVVWNGRDRWDRRVATGSYLARLTVDGVETTRMVTVLR